MAEKVYLIENCFCASNAARSSQHLYKHPVELDCKHYVCSSCLDSCSDELVKCTICGYNTIKSFIKRDTIATEAQVAIIENIREIYQHNDQLHAKNLDGLFQLSQTIEAHFEYFDERMELRVECIKVEIDKTVEKLLKKLRKYEKKQIKVLNSGNSKESLLNLSIENCEIKVKKCQESVIYSQKALSGNANKVFEINPKQVATILIGKLNYVHIEPCLSWSWYNRQLRSVREKPRYNKSLTCTNCGRKGHLKRYCNQITCYLCDRKGHIRVDCLY